MQILDDNEHSFIFCMGLVRNMDDKQHMQNDNDGWLSQRKKLGTRCMWVSPIIVLKTELLLLAKYVM